jgi:hypothetical protein
LEDAWDWAFYEEHPFKITSKGIIVYPDKTVKVTPKGFVEGGEGV